MPGLELTVSVNGNRLPPVDLKNHHLVVTTRPDKPLGLYDKQVIPGPEGMDRALNIPPNMIRCDEFRMFAATGFCLVGLDNKSVSVLDFCMTPRFSPWNIITVYQDKPLRFGTPPHCISFSVQYFR